MSASVHGIDRRTQGHLCGVTAGIGTDAWSGGMVITCQTCLAIKGETEVLQGILHTYLTPHPELGKDEDNRGCVPCWFIARAVLDSGRVAVFTGAGA